MEGFIDWVKPTVMDRFSCTMHKLGNCLIEIEGDRAYAETYAIVHHILAGEERSSDMIMGVRYIDRLEQRRGEWKIANRRMSFEWERNVEIGSQGELVPYPQGGRDGSDPVLRPVAVSVPVTLARVEDRADIYAAHMRFCRGFDRRDEGLIRSAYHADARADHGAYEGGLDGFIEFVTKEVHARFRTTMHKLGQVLVEFDAEGDPDVAWSEAYAICHHVTEEGGRDVADRVVGLRYHDRFERRDGEWRIAHRELRYEWLRIDALEPLDASWTLGRAGAGDPVFADLTPEA
ncbi:MAG: hypothetical protein CL908_20250 [Deltaproteobacteria bacterium]|nr:hypothetical protein [Deltaproteobacteria bacterium]